MNARVVELALEVRRDDVLHFLDYPEGREPPARIEALLSVEIAEGRNLVSARGAYVSLPVEEAPLVGLEPTAARGLVLGLVTAGPRVESAVKGLLDSGQLTRAVLLDAVGSAAAEEAADRLGAIIVGDSPSSDGDGGAVSCRVSPGYGAWTIEHQAALFDRLPANEVGVTLQESMLMQPRKSISFAMWLGAPARPTAGLSGCIRCTLTHCRYRRSPGSSHEPRPPPSHQPARRRRCRRHHRRGLPVSAHDRRARRQRAGQGAPARGAGATEHAGRIRIPEALARDAAASAPSRIRVFDRAGDLAMDLGEDRVHFDPGSAAIHIYDMAANGRREVSTADVAAFTRLVDALDHYAAQSTALVPADVPQEVADRHRLFLVLSHSTKPVITGTFLKDAFAPMHAMLSAIRGGEQALADKPLAIFDCCPSPPLKWSDLTCQALVDCARAGIPAELVSMPLTGATSPVTLREAVVQHCAENLSGVTIHQLASRGAPIIYGGSPAAFDMRKGTTPMGAVETMMIDAAYAQVGKRLGLPTHAYLGLSDAKCPDYQAGMETGIGAIIGALAGVNVISGPGMLDYETTQSLEKIALDHDAVGMAHRLVRGIARREGDSVALIGALVAAGEFLSHDHTRRNWRRELSIASPVVDRDTYGDWEAKGSLWAHQRAHTRVDKLLGKHRPAPLDEGVETELRAIMLAEARRHGMDALPPMI